MNSDESTRQEVNKSTGARRSSQDDVDLLNVDLWTCQSAPDLTRSIMGRLGYMRVPPQVSRRHRIMRWTMRCVLIALMGVAVTLGLKAYQASPDARRPAAVTMPMAVTHDLQHHQTRFGTVLRLLQEVPSRLDEPRIPGDLDDPADFEVDPDDVDEDVNRSAIAPVRWV